MLTTRLWMGAILVALTAGMLVLDPGLAPWFPFLALFVLGLSLAASRELIGLLGPNRAPLSLLCYIGVLLLGAGNWLVQTPWAREHVGSPWNGLAWIFVALVLAVFLWEMGTFVHAGRSIERMAVTVWILTYLGLLPCCLAQMRWLEIPGCMEASTSALALAIFVPKCCDIGAYCTGRLLGRTPMTPVLSPKKTWEGAAGGLALGAMAAILIDRLGPAPLLHRDVRLELAFAISVGIAGMLGDLAESLIKRDCQQKDASRAVPGFGGVLDIVDSVIFSAPVSYFLILAFASSHPLAN